MARIAGVDLPVQKRIWVGLTSIYGIGQPRAKSLCAKANVDHTKKVKDLTEEERLFLNGSMLLSGCVRKIFQKGSFNMQELLQDVRDLISNTQ